MLPSETPPTDQIGPLAALGFCDDLTLICSVHLADRDVDRVRAEAMQRADEVAEASARAAEDVGQPASAGFSTNRYRPPDETDGRGCHRRRPVRSPLR